jgi:hypothetical protein
MSVSDQGHSEVAVTEQAGSDATKSSLDPAGRATREVSLRDLLAAYDDRGGIRMSEGPKALWS